MEQIPSRLWEGLRRLQGVPGITVHKHQHTTHQGLFVIPVEVDLGPDHAGEDVPRRTRWYLHASRDYPLGPVRFYPAKNGGITKTWPHQTRNVLHDDASIPWRMGKPCLEIYGELLDHHRSTGERLDNERLKWRGEQLLRWLRAAAAGRLTEDGTLLEFPDYRRDTLASLGYVGSDCQGIEPPTWSQPGTTGRAHLLRFPGPQGPTIDGPLPHFYLHRVTHLDITIKRAQPWRKVFVDAAAKVPAAWVATATVPFEEPWHPIDSFAGLDAFLKRNHASLQDLLEQLPAAAWREPEIFLLVAAKIPRRRGEPPERISWHGLRINLKDHNISSPHDPSLSPRLVARALLRSKKPVKWMQTHDYAHTQHLARGQIASYLQGARIAILGCGALGSPVAEYLVRGGANDLVLVDDDVLEPGNLVRHTLTQTDVGRDKVDRLAKRLEDIHPFVKVEAIDAKIPLLTDDQWQSVESCTLVLNLTADPHVDEYLARRTWTSTAVLVHAAMTLHAKHLLVDIQQGPTWSPDSVREQYDRHEGLLAEGKEEVLQVPGDIGCRNPLFPAKAYDIAARAADLVRLLDRDDPALGGHCIPPEE